MSAPDRRCRSAGRGLVEQRLGGASMTEFPDIIKVPIRPRVFVSYHWGDREPQQEAKPPVAPPPDGLREHPGAARLRRGLEILLRQDASLGRKPRRSSPDGLKTAAQAAAKLNCSIKTLNAHVASGALRCVDIGHGRERRRPRFTDADLNEFVANQTRKV